MLFHFCGTRETLLKCFLIMMESSLPKPLKIYDDSPGRGVIIYVNKRFFHFQDFYDKHNLLTRADIIASSCFFGRNFMKYMTFNSSCTYAGLANMLMERGIDVEDYEIALEMKLPFLLKGMRMVSRLVHFCSLKNGLTYI